MKAGRANNGLNGLSGFQTPAPVCRGLPMSSRPRLSPLNPLFNVLTPFNPLNPLLNVPTPFNPLNPLFNVLTPGIRCAR